MARFIGPKGKLVRRFGENIFENPKYDRLLERKAHPPGQHGDQQKRRKISDYARQLNEKQKLKVSYGLLEKQFRRTFNEASRRKGVTGENLLQLLETRLDNAVYRAGFAVTRTQSRQLVSHGHVQVNGRRVDVPSCQLRPGDVISVDAREKSRQLISRNLQNNPNFKRPDWVKTDSEALTASVLHLPNGGDINSQVNLQLIVELYSK